MTKEGWHVYATCRNITDCMKLQAQGFASFPLDYTDTASITRAVATIKERGGLHALFNNGAFALPGALEDLPTDGLREIFEANLFGYHELTRQVIPIMRAQGHGKIVNCSSVLGLVPAKYRGAYVATKYALEGLTDVLRLELASANIQVVLIEPGPIKTKIRENARGPFEKWIDWQNSPRRAEYETKIMPRLYNDNPDPDAFELQASAVSDKLLHAVSVPYPAARYRVTGATYLSDVARRVLPTKALDWVINKVEK